MIKTKKFTLNELRALTSIIKSNNLILLDMQTSIIGKLYHKRYLSTKNMCNRIIKRIKNRLET